ncbi:hypothetical protein MGU_11044 [Metarhizium guizhouense ARSEF 977]|uniref:Uncharacterized protein n=1 Tax=Metarhizium guizhouense (strain ARSEF 977) TaxID=1276136 RepID=A0A0B4GPF4_METGA|nr:hypothetical protein MGU_11044 [Metarhizium guizhouense ARSEF 977]
MFGGKLLALLPLLQAQVWGLAIKATDLDGNLIKARGLKEAPHCTSTFAWSPANINDAYEARNKLNVRDSGTSTVTIPTGANKCNDISCSGEAKIVVCNNSGRDINLTYYTILEAASVSMGPCLNAQVQGKVLTQGFFAEDWNVIVRKKDGNERCLV